MRVWIAALFWLCTPLFAQTQTGFLDLSDMSRAQLQRYQALTMELRCLVCQNQSIADSNAELAQDMRKLVHEQIMQGRSDAQIKDYLIARYGDFVLYRPPVKASTWLLWFGPFGLLLMGLATVVVISRRRARARPVRARADDAERLKKLLDKEAP